MVWLTEQCKAPLRQLRSTLCLSAVLALTACAPLPTASPPAPGAGGQGAEPGCGPEGRGGAGCPPAPPPKAPTPEERQSGRTSAAPVPAPEAAPAHPPSVERPAEPQSEPPRESDQQGLASWYGPGLHGRRTASGERFDRYELTAAHRTLPFGSRVCVRSAITGKTVVVRINDRGPFTGGRVIDLSQAAAQALGMTGLGIKPVELWLLGQGEEMCPDALPEAATLVESGADAPAAGSLGAAAGGTAGAAPRATARQPSRAKARAAPRAERGRARNGRR